MIGFIVNPISGNGRGQRVWSRLTEFLTNNSIPFTVKFTARSRDAIQFAKELSQQQHAMNAIIAVGGDGTLHEVANGLYQCNSTIALGFIPAGSGNDFARAFGIPSDPLEALRLILHSDKVIKIDLIRHHDRIAVDSAGAGFDATVARMTNLASYKNGLNRLKLGKLAYVWSLVRVLTSFKPSQATVTVDGIAHSFQQVWLVTAANIPYFGGGMKICPTADPCDGEASICIVSGVSRLELLTVFPRVYKGSHVGHPAVHFLQGRQITLFTEHPLDIHLDGEAAGVTPATFEVIPAALSVIVG